MPSKDDKILVVDDLKEVLTITADIVKSGGYTNIIAFSDSVKAKEYLLANEIDVLVTDIQMPVVGGAELIDIAFQQKVPRLIAVSGSICDGDSMHEALSNLGAAVISKPFKAEVLLNAIAG